MCPAFENIIVITIIIVFFCVNMHRPIEKDKICFQTRFFCVLNIKIINCEFTFLDSMCITLGICEKLVYNIPSN